MTNKYIKTGSFSGEFRDVFLTKDKYFGGIIIDSEFSVGNDYQSIDIERVYLSQTGLSGDIKIKSDYPLIQVGTYRVDMNDKHNRRTIPIDLNRNKYFIYVPIKAHESLLYNEKYCTVISNSSHVLMCGGNLHYILNEIKENGFEDFYEFKKHTLEYYDCYFEKKNYDVYYYKTGNFKGVDVVKYSYFNYHQSPARWYKDNDFLSCDSNILNTLGYIKFNRDGDIFVCEIGKYQEIKNIFKTESEALSYLNVNEYNYRDLNFIWLRNKNDFIVETSDFNYEYHLTVKDIDLVLNDEIKYISHCADNIITKIETDKQNNEKIKNHIDLIKEKISNITVITSNDSYKVGNCVAGTQDFIKQFNLKDPVSGIDLLNHKDFYKMLDNEQFRRVILNMINNLVET